MGFPDGGQTDASKRPPVLEIKNLTVAYREHGRFFNAVQDVSLRVHAGETYGLVGESGSGKTTLALAVMRYLSRDGLIRSGEVWLNGRNLLALSRSEMREVWGRQVALVPQDPQSSLNPAMRIGQQVAEAVRRWDEQTAGKIHLRTLALLEKVHLADPERVICNYPHQISGGMQQRVMIAMALAAKPLLLILDEPTTSLDVTTQAAILDLVKELIRERGTAAIYVTHNLGVVAQVCDRVAVLYAGELVEDAETRKIFHTPLHPYTRGLLDSVPRLGERKQGVRLGAIEGQIPPLDDRPSGCVFRDRCPLAIEICLERPPLYQPSPDRRTRCHRWDEIAQGDVDARQPGAPIVPAEPVDSPAGVPVLATEDLEVWFPINRSLPGMLRGEAARAVRAVDGVDIEVERGRTLGLVGESGSGKTTLARAAMGLSEATGGKITLLGSRLPPDLAGRNLEILRRLQMVFQNPDAALNPYHTIGESLMRPLVALSGMGGAEAEREVARLLEAVRLPPAYAERLPDQLSGGEKQRVAIARAFATNPDLLIADEPVSSLDVSVQAAILNLLNELQREQETSLLFISHNLAVVGYLSDRIAVIYLGRLMEVTAAEDMFGPPYHPYTEALLSAIPLADPDATQESIRLEGEIPSPANVPTGCPFHTRCPRFLGEICVVETPPWRDVPGMKKRYYCHIPQETLLEIQPRAFGVVKR